MKQLIALALILLFSSCKKDKIDPHEAIQGKWEEFYLGNGEPQPWREPTGYRHFMEDSIIVDYNYKDKSISKKKYWIDTLLHTGTPLGKDLLFVRSYEYRFDGDTLRVELVDATAILYLSKYKRVH